MSDKLCTSDEAILAVGYLRHAYGGYPIPDPEQRAHLRLFRTCTVNEVRQAIDDLVASGHARRPSPAEIGERIRLLRRASPPVPEPLPEPADPEVTRWGLELCRAALGRKPGTVGASGIDGEAAVASPLASNMCSGYVGTPISSQGATAPVVNTRTSSDKGVPQ